MEAWKKETCSERPLELQSISPSEYIQRKDIEEVKHKKDKELGTPAYTSYECMSRIIKKSEYELLQAINAINDQKAIDEYTQQLIDEGMI